MIAFSKRHSTDFASPSSRPGFDGGLPIRKSQTMQPLTTAYIHAGDFIVVADPFIQLTTVLGSCVSACILDPLTGIGGMNHFILPEQKNMVDAGPRERYGIFAMRALVDALYARGAIRSRLQAKLYGGAKMLFGGGNIGLMNAQFAQSFLHDEGIRIVGGSLGGEASRRVRFHPATGATSVGVVHQSKAEVPLPHLIECPKFALLLPIRIDGHPLRTVA